MARLPMPPTGPVAQRPAFAGFVGLTPPRPGPTGPTRHIPSVALVGVRIPPLPSSAAPAPRRRPRAVRRPPEFVVGRVPIR